MAAHLYEINTATGEQFPEVASDFPTQNADFTEHIIPIRDGIYWSDGTQLTAHDVAFTMYWMRNTAEYDNQAFYERTFASIEAISDFEVKLVTNDPFPRIAQRFGVVLWGRELRIMPSHIYSEVDDVLTFHDSDPVVAGPYSVHSFDPMGNWVLYQLRSDWERSTVGQVRGGARPQAEYVWFRVIGADDTTRQMAFINNEVDVLMEVTPEMLEVMTAQNPNIGAWFAEFPWATSDDPCSKGISIQQGHGAPWNDRLFRWGLALAVDFDMISLSIFDGIGRSSPFPILTATSAMEAAYTVPMLPWLEALTVDPGDGGDPIYVWDGGYAERMGNTLRNMGRPIPTGNAELLDMFGHGTWAFDPEGATRLFQAAGLELRGEDWYFDDEPFVIPLNFLAEIGRASCRERVSVRV
jgi:peptide/nickel transport system substrate-binding protein